MDTPHISVRRLTKAVERSHYLVAAFGSTEAMRQKVVVITDDVAEPTWVLRPGTRAIKQSNIMALALPSLSDLTLELAQAHTRMVTSFITLHEFPVENRRRGIVAPGRRLHTPWQS